MFGLVWRRGPRAACSPHPPSFPHAGRSGSQELPAPGTQESTGPALLPALCTGYFFGLENPSRMTSTPQLYGLRFPVTQSLTTSTPT